MGGQKYGVFKLKPHQLVEEIRVKIQPREGTGIVLTERPGSPNWIAGVGLMNPTKTARFHVAVSALRKSTPIVDWSAVTNLAGTMRRVSSMPKEAPPRPYFGRRAAAAA